MDTLDFYQVDSFTNKLFRGNPAGVIFNSELSDSQMQKIALENNLSETAFIETKDNNFFIKWFSPLMEIDLCGHATLAAAHIYFTEIDTKANKINFNSKSGILNVYKEDDFLYLDFPSDNIKKIEPFGTANPNPIFLFKDFKVIKINILKNNCLSVILKSKIGFSIKSIYFDSTNNKVTKYLLNYKKTFNVLGQISENIWNNKKTLQLTIHDLII